MNRRQKKKQYKKLHGYNPPKYVWGVDMAPIPDFIGERKLDGQEASSSAVSIPDVEIIATGLREFSCKMQEAIANMTGALGRSLMKYSKSIRPRRQQDPVTVTAEALTKRRKERCRTRW